MRDFEAHGLLQDQPEALEEGVQLPSLCGDWRCRAFGDGQGGRAARVVSSLSLAVLPGAGGARAFTDTGRQQRGEL